MHVRHKDSSFLNTHHTTGSAPCLTPYGTNPVMTSDELSVKENQTDG